MTGTRRAAGLVLTAVAVPALVASCLRHQWVGAGLMTALVCVGTGWWYRRP